MQSGVDVKTLAGMLGHYSAGFTLDTYTHITNQMQYTAADKIGSFMNSATGAAKPDPEPPTPPETATPFEEPEAAEPKLGKVIPFERVG